MERGKIYQVVAVAKRQLLKGRKIAQPIRQSFHSVKFLYPQLFKGSEELNFVRERVECRTPTQ